MRILTPLLAISTVSASLAASVNTPSNTPSTAPGAPTVAGQTTTTQKKSAYEWLQENVVLSYTGQFMGPNLYSWTNTPDIDDSRIVTGHLLSDTVWLWNRANVGWRINPSTSLVVQQRFFLTFANGMNAILANTRVNFGKTDVLDGSVAKLGLGLNVELPTTANAINDSLLMAPALSVATDYKVPAGWELGHVFSARYFSRMRAPRRQVIGSNDPIRVKGDAETNDWYFYGSVSTAYNINDTFAPGFQAQIGLDHKFGFSGINFEDLDLQPQLAINIGNVQLQPYFSFHPVHFANSQDFRKSTYFGMNIAAKLF